MKMKMIIIKENKRFIFKPSRGHGWDVETRVSLRRYEDLKKIDLKPWILEKEEDLK